MTTARFAVVGHPIGHTMSPFIHLRLFALAGIRAEYEVFDIPPENLLYEAEHSLAALDGYNLTIPHKSVIIPALAKMSEKASLYRSVNTVRNGSERCGWTTDPFGFLQALRAEGIPLAGSVTVLGSGGVARVFVFEAVLAGASVTIAVRDQGLERAAALCSAAKALVPDAKVTVCTFSQLAADNRPIDLLVNATPVGMFPNTGCSPVDESVLRRSAAVYDAVYNPAETALMAAARANGSRVLGGMSMLVYQAVESHRIWHGSQYEKAAVDELIRDALQEMQRKFSE
ncbi:MAG: shikimate dehydrogenase [Firmicutes bacterium]|nr:shikimate dehydrogenase [Bacillota bacterium]